MPCRLNLGRVLLSPPRVTQMVTNLRSDGTCTARDVRQTQALIFGELTEELVRTSTTISVPSSKTTYAFKLLTSLFCAPFLRRGFCSARLLARTGARENYTLPRLGMSGQASLCAGLWLASGYDSDSPEDRRRALRLPRWQTCAVLSSRSWG